MGLNVTESHDVNTVINHLTGTAPLGMRTPDRDEAINSLARLADSAVKRLLTGFDNASAREALEQHLPRQTSPTDPDELSEWLRKWPRRTIFRDTNGTAWQRGYGQIAYYRDGESLAAEEDTEEYAALLSVATTDAMCIEAGASSLPALAMCAPFTVLALGEGYDEDEA